MGKVIIGVDPHKRVHAIVVLDADAKVLARRTFANSTVGYRELMSFARGWRQRTWAIEGSGGVGKHLAQCLVSNGEHVLPAIGGRRGTFRSGNLQRCGSPLPSS